MGRRRDLIGLPAKAVRTEGMRLGVSGRRAFNRAWNARRADFDTGDSEFFGLNGRANKYLFSKEMADDRQHHWPPRHQQFQNDGLAGTCELVDNELRGPGPP